MSIAKNISIKFVAVFVTVGMIVTTVFAAPVSAQSVSDLQGQIDSLLKQINQLNNDGGRSTVRTGGSCSYNFNRNLSIGSTGEDVRQLQQFLNSDSDTRVSSSGAGSSGSETTYYGPATGRAVARFQEKYAADILTPIGLSSGTPNFYTSTRAKVNSLCSGSGGPGVTQSGGSGVVTGNLSVEVLSQPKNIFVAEGAQRVNFTKFRLTATGGSVKVRGVTVYLSGAESDSSVKTVALVDSTGVQYGSARKFNRDDEAKVGGTFTIRSGNSVDLTVVGNVVFGDDFDSGQVASIHVREIATDQGDVSTNIVGATHTIITRRIGDVEIDVKTSGGGSIELGEEEDFFEADIEVGKKEDVDLLTIFFEQKGNVSSSDFGDLVLEIGKEEYDVEHFEGDKFVVYFGRNGYTIEEGEDERIVIKGTVDGGDTGDTVQFEIEETSDVYARGVEERYGVRVSFDGDDNTGYRSTLSSGSSGRGGRTGFSSSDRRNSPGDDRLLGDESFRIRGDDIRFDELEFDVELSNLPNNFKNDDDDGYFIDDDNDNNVDAGERVFGIDEFVIERAYLEVNGERVADAEDDIIFEDNANSSRSITVEEVIFSGEFEVEADEDEDVVFAIYGDLDNDWAELDGVEIKFTLVDADEIETVETEENRIGSFTNGSDDETKGSGQDFNDSSIEGNSVRFSIRNTGVDEDEIVTGTDDVVFGSLRVDAEDAVENVEVNSVVLTFTKNGDADWNDLRNCSIDGEEREDASVVDRGTDTATPNSGRVNFDGLSLTVEAGEEEDFEITCDIDENAVANDEFKLAVETGDEIEYEIDREDYTFKFENAQSSRTITVQSVGSIDVSLDTPSDSNDNDGKIAVATSSSDRTVEVLEIEVEAESEDITIEDILIDGISLGKNTSINLEDFIEDAVVSLNGSSDRVEGTNDSDLEVSSYDSRGNLDTAISLSSSNKALLFEETGFEIQAGDTETITVSLTYAPITDSNGKAGEYLTMDNVHIIYSGDRSNVYGSVTKSIGTNGLEVKAFNAIPVVTSSDDSPNLSSGTGRELYEFTVTAEGDNIYLDQASFNVVISQDSDGADLTVNNYFLRSGGNLNEVSVKDTDADGGEIAVKFTTPERINKGRSKTFTLVADIANVTSNDSVNVELLTDEANADNEIGVQNGPAATAYNFVWSPDSLDNGDAKTSNPDWFSGYAVFENNDLGTWRLD